MTSSSLMLFANQGTPTTTAPPHSSSSGALCVCILHDYSPHRPYNENGKWTRLCVLFFPLCAVCMVCGCGVFLLSSIPSSFFLIVFCFPTVKDSWHRSQVPRKTEESMVQTDLTIMHIDETLTSSEMMLFMTFTHTTAEREKGSIKIILYVYIYSSPVLMLCNHNYVSLWLSNGVGSSRLSASVTWSVFK